MVGNIVYLAAVVLGVDVGWQPRPEGGVEYLIQIEPHLLDALKSGEAIQSEIPPDVKNVRSYRISVGTGSLPREVPTVEQIQPPDPFVIPPRPHGVDSGTPPQTLPPETTGSPIREKPADHTDVTGAAPPAEASPSDKPATDQAPASSSTRPWTPLTLSLLALFASLGGNAYLFWVARDARNRYRVLVEQTDGAQGGGQQPEY